LDLEDEDSSGESGNSDTDQDEQTAVERSSKRAVESFENE